MAVLVSLSICFSTHAIALPGSLQDSDAPQGETGYKNVTRELGLFRSVQISLQQALMAAHRLHEGAQVVDISFEGQSGIALYRIKSCRENRIWDDAVDAQTGQVLGTATETSLADLSMEDQRTILALRNVRQNLADAVVVAERAASGKAISAGLKTEDGRLNFVVVVAAGNDLRQVLLEPPTGKGKRSRRHRRR